MYFLLKEFLLLVFVNNIYSSDQIEVIDEENKPRPLLPKVTKLRVLSSDKDFYLYGNQNEYQDKRETNMRRVNMIEEDVKDVISYGTDLNENHACNGENTKHEDKQLRKSGNYISHQKITMLQKLSFDTIKKDESIYIASDELEKSQRSHYTCDKYIQESQKKEHTHSNQSLKSSNEHQYNNINTCSFPQEKFSLRVHYNKNDSFTQRILLNKQYNIKSSNQYITDHENKGPMIDGNKNFCEKNNNFQQPCYFNIPLENFQQYNFHIDLYDKSNNEALPVQNQYAQSNIQPNEPVYLPIQCLNNQTTPQNSTSQHYMQPNFYRDNQGNLKISNPPPFYQPAQNLNSSYSSELNQPPNIAVQDFNNQGNLKILNPPPCYQPAQNLDSSYNSELNQPPNTAVQNYNNQVHANFHQPAQHINHQHSNQNFILQQYMQTAEHINHQNNGQNFTNLNFHQPVQTMNPQIFTPQLYIQPAQYMNHQYGSQNFTPLTLHQPVQNSDNQFHFQTNITPSPVVQNLHPQLENNCSKIYNPGDYSERNSIQHTSTNFMNQRKHVDQRINQNSYGIRNQATSLYVPHANVYLRSSLNFKSNEFIEQNKTDNQKQPIFNSKNNSSFKDNYENVNSNNSYQKKNQKADLRPFQRYETDRTPNLYGNRLLHSENANSFKVKQTEIKRKDNEKVLTKFYNNSINKYEKNKVQNPLQMNTFTNLTSEAHFTHHQRYLNNLLSENNIVITREKALAAPDVFEQDLMKLVSFYNPRVQRIDNEREKLIRQYLKEVTCDNARIIRYYKAKLYLLLLDHYMKFNGKVRKK